jgi:hypothetical protein
MSTDLEHQLPIIANSLDRQTAAVTLHDVLRAAGHGDEVAVTTGRSVLRGQRDLLRRPRWTVITPLLATAAAVALVVVILLNRAPDNSIVAATPVSTQTTLTDSIQPNAWWDGLAQLPSDLATIPLPPPGDITLHAVDGRILVLHGTSDSLCVTEQATGGQGCRQATAGAHSLSVWAGGSMSASANGNVGPIFSYWLTSDAITVSLVDSHGRSVCDQGPQAAPAYPGVTLWTCISSGTTQRTETKSIYRANNVNYIFNSH